MDHYRIRATFLEWMASRDIAWPQPTTFRHFFRSRGYEGQVERQWRRLRAGDAVPASIAAAFVDYLRVVRDLPMVALDEAFEPCAPVPEKGAWESPAVLRKLISGPFRDDDSMYMQNPYDDFITAARMVVHTVGHKMAEPGEPLDEAACLHRGSLKMGRTIEEYAGWLRDITRNRLYRAAMFYLVNRRRVGVTVLLPLKERSFERLCSGRLREDHLEPDDLESPSRFLFMAAMSDGQGCRGVSPLARTMAQSNVFLYQMTYLTRGIRPFRPVIASFAANAHYEALFRAQGLVPNGHHLMGTDFPILVLRHPDEASGPSRPDATAYRTYVRLMRVYRFFNRNRWALEDSLDRPRRRRD